MPDLAATNSTFYAELAATYVIYASLMRECNAETALGGKLLYAGELTPESSRMVRAANVTGAASFCATADAAMQRAAIREGVVDFLVTALDEALRILKNEIRKKQTVAVCVGASPDVVIAEMKDRGVLPDLLPPLLAGCSGTELDVFLTQGARRVEVAALPENCFFVALEQPPADFEARALELIPESEFAARRWLRLSPPYLGSRARRVRSVACTRMVADKLLPSS